MDSTITLVNPAPIELNFSNNDMYNSTLYVQRQPLYKLVTSDDMLMKTDVRDANTNELLFGIKLRDFLPDLISFTYHDNGKPKHMKKWLKKAVDNKNRKISYTMQTEFGNYEWIVDSTHRMELYPAGSRIGPLARLVVNATPRLWLEAGTERFRDQILASFLIIERDLRSEEAKKKIKAGITEASASSASQLGGSLNTLFY